MPATSLDDYSKYVGTDPDDSLTYEHVINGLDEGLMKMHSVISKILGFDIMCDDFTKMEPFRNSLKLNLEAGNSYYSTYQTNLLHFWSDWIN